MKTFSFISLAAALLPGPCVPSALADGGVINIRVSVKVIRSSTGAEPTNGLTAPATVDSMIKEQIDHGNEVLRRTQRGYRLLLVPSFSLPLQPLQRVQPPAPSGQAANYWFDLYARDNRAAVENAAEADKTTWKWDNNAINIYVNNTSSGECSFPANGDAVLLGSELFNVGTVVHEIGHFFALKHTHQTDFTQPPNLPDVNGNYSIHDGDGFPATANDNPNVSRDQLSQIIYGGPYNSLTAAQQTGVNSAFENVMSYHEENEFLPDQMNLWTNTANRTDQRHYAVSGWSRYVETYGSDTIPPFGIFNDGITSTFPLRTLAKAVANAGAANDGDEIILLGNAHFNEPMTISTPVTLRTSQGNTAVIGKP